MPFTFKLPKFLEPGVARAFMEEVLKPFLEHNAEYLQYELELVTPIGVSSQLRGSYSTQVRGTIDELNFRGVVISNSTYIRAVDEGSRPHWAPIDNLRAWAELKNMNVYALQIHIARHGTQPQHLFEAARHNAFPTISLDWQRTVGALIHKYRAGL